MAELLESRDECVIRTRMSKTLRVVPLCEMEPNQEAVCFALLVAKQELRTRDGKPYFKVAFRDRRREVSFPIWGDSPLADDCQKGWTVGVAYKIRAILRETSYGPQLDIVRIREAGEADAAEGYDAAMFLPQSRFEPQTMWDELLGLANAKIAEPALRALVLAIHERYRARLLTLPAATRNHHAYVAGYLQHVLSVTHNALLLAERYARLYADLTPPLDVGLVVAGAMLHDIGKLYEIEQTAQGAQYTAAGSLIGHLVQGRDIVRELAREHPVDADTLLRLEHIILSHQRLPEWGSPKPPMTPEALLVHYADDIDAKFEMMYVALRDDPSPGPMTSKNNTLYQQVYRGPGASAAP